MNAEAKIDDEMDRVQFKTQLWREICQFDADQRNTFLLRFQENFSIKEISQILSCPAGTVKSRLYYITQKLAIKLKDFDPSEKEVSTHGK